MGKPAIIMLKTRFWANWYEEDDVDFQKIKQIVESELSSSQFVSGVLVYSSDFRNGRFIENKNVLESARVIEEEVKTLFN